MTLDKTKRNADNQKDSQIHHYFLAISIKRNIKQQKKIKDLKQHWQRINNSKELWYLERKQSHISLGTFSCESSFLFELEFGDSGFWGLGRTQQKPSEQGENQQQFQPSYDAGPKSNLGQIGGRLLRSHHCAIRVPQSVVRSIQFTVTLWPCTDAIWNVKLLQGESVLIGFPLRSAKISFLDGIALSTLILLSRTIIKRKPLFHYYGRQVVLRHEVAFWKQWTKSMKAISIFSWACRRNAENSGLLDEKRS